MLLQRNPFDYHPLKDGDAHQRRAYDILNETRLFEFLAGYSPAHIGTIGSCLHIATSDIDVACSSGDFNGFKERIYSSFAAEFAVTSYQGSRAGTPYMVFTIPTSIPIEVYCEEAPTHEQAAYRHFLVTLKLLDLGGEELRSKILALRALGGKTEPSIMKALGIHAQDPYKELLRIADSSAEDLALMVRAALNK